MTDIKKEFSPSVFMRARRPELFSDTVQLQEAMPDIRQFEFYLETLTQRKEETDFEHFCRRLAEKEICPNLIVQTGPVGGGDSKTDTETYPVASAIAHRWYVGNPEQSSRERWAFAFSAKKQWRSKVRQDVQKIVETNRGYSLIYFIGNQAIRDKDRADLEDELKKKWKIPVRILDRNWILNAVTKNNRWDVVYQTLDISRPAVTTYRPGPLDTKRQAELDELEKLIGNPTRYQGSEYQLVQDCLEAAKIARSLGKPRIEVDGRFDRAERIAITNHLDRYRFLILYQRAWAAFWWFNDYSELNRIYEQIEEYGLKAEWIWDAEKLVNLWHIASGWNRTAFEKEPKWTDRTIRLRAALSQHSGNTEKPTGALWARTLLVLMDLINAAALHAPLDGVVKNLRDIVKQARGHSEYPMEGLTRMLQELGNIPQVSDAFGDVIEELIELESSRSGESVEGEARLQRGLQLLKQEKTYDAITQCARAQILLAKEETYSEFLQAIVVTGLAFEAAGLLWAARGNIITALDRALVSYFKEGKIAPQAVSLCRKLVWLELQLGRPTWVQIWWEWIASLQTAAPADEEIRESMDEEARLMDAVLGILILRTSSIDLKSLDRIPALYDYLGLHMSRDAMLFALGHEDIVSSELHVSPGEIDITFRRLLTQPAADDVPKQPEWFLPTKVSMRTLVLGCQIEILAENNALTVLFGESLLAFIESFFSTVIARKRHFASLPYLKIDLRQSEFADMPFSLHEDEDDCGETTLTVAHPKMDPAELLAPANDKSFLALLATLIKLMRINYSHSSLKNMFSEERAQDRAFLSARSIIAVTNILSNSPKYQVDAWIEGLSEERFELRRTEVWPALNESQADEDTTAKPTEFAYAVGKPPPELSGVDALKHSDLRIISLINMPLWDRAKWKGLGFAFREEEPPIPGLVLVFEDMEAGKKIFRGWRKRVGQNDEADLIGVTLILGIERKKPFNYRVAIGLNEKALNRKLTDTTFFTLVYRMQDMAPRNATYVQQFIQEYERAGRYFIAPGQMSAGAGPYASNLEIDKKELRVVHAWQIGENDPIRVALGSHDDPVIPSDVTDPPILTWLRKRRRKSSE